MNRSASLALRIASLALLVGAALVAVPIIRAEAETLAVVKVTATPTVTKNAAATPKSAAGLTQVLESIDQQLPVALGETGKFQIVSRGELDALLQNDEFNRSGLVDPATAKQFAAVGARYLAHVTLDNFQDRVATQNLDSIGKIRVTREVRLSAVVKIYEAANGKLLRAASLPLTHRDSENWDRGVQLEGTGSTELLSTLGRDLAGRVANRITDVIFPATVVAKRGKFITVNRGDGTNIQPGQVWEVFAVGDEMFDPKTKASLGQEEYPVGKARVTGVRPATTQLEILEDTGIEIGAIIRLLAEAPKEAPVAPAPSVAPATPAAPSGK